MNELIEALQIFLKYDNADPSSGDLAELRIYGYHKGNMTDEDIQKLDNYGFHWDEDNECFYSYKLGSC